jgi:hypothetical protein
MGSDLIICGSGRMHARCDLPFAYLKTKRQSDVLPGYYGNAVCHSGIYLSLFSAATGNTRIYVIAKLLQRRHINHKPIPDITLKHPLVSIVDVFDRYHFHITDNIMLGAEVKHFLRFR